MNAGATIAPQRSARNHRGASRSAVGGTAVSPRAAMVLRSADDIAGIRAAGQVVAKALEAARAACVVGATTAQIDAVIRDTITSAGGSPVFMGYRGSNLSGSDLSASRPAFPAASCISVNEELVHGVPGDRVIRSGDVVAIDTGARVDGWCADSAITVCVGNVAAERRALVDCAERMLAYAVTAIRPGLRWSDIARGIERIATDAGFAVAVDFVGHGIGRDLHEPPQVPCSIYESYLERGDFTLRPGMVLAIEPMVVLERPTRNDRGEQINPAVTLRSDAWTMTVNSGACSCHVEHTIAVTRDGAEVLTALDVCKSFVQPSAVARATSALVG